jgi:hypothetical protein
LHDRWGGSEAIKAVHDQLFVNCDCPNCKPNKEGK